VVVLATSLTHKHLWPPGRKQISEVTMANAITRQGPGYPRLAGQVEMEGAKKG